MGFIHKIPKQNDLHRAILEQDWPGARTHLKYHPKDARQWADITFDDDRTSEMLPLHQAVQTYAPLDLILQLIKAYPKAVAKRDSYFHRYPLHFACLHSNYPALITCLIEHHREAVFASDIFGRIPLHYAAFGGAHDCVVRSLLQIYPAGARCKDTAGWLPLHVAVRYRCSHAVIEDLVRAYPSALRAKTTRGKHTPARVVRVFKLPLDDKTLKLLNTPYPDHRRSSAFADYPKPQLLQINAVAV